MPGRRLIAALILPLLVAACSARSPTTVTPAPVQTAGAGPSTAVEALQRAQTALDQAGGYTLTVDQSNFVLSGWGGTDGGSVQVTDAGKTAQATLARTGEPGATYMIVLYRSETFFKRSTCNTMF